jgi:adenylosuccinate synthase
VPSGILNEKAKCVVGNGVVVHLPGMFEEIDTLEKAGVKIDASRLVISDRAHMLFDLHKEIDGLREAELSGNKIGTTKRGIGPAYASKATRNGIRVGDIKNMETFAVKLRTLAADAAARFDDFEYDVEAELEAYKKYAERIMPHIADTVELINSEHKSGKRVLVEGANATMLDLDFGTYPFVTSSNPSLGGVCSGLGLAPNKFETVIGVAKAYTTRVGAGPYPTELDGQLAEDLREQGFEYGTTTGRPRRIGWLDIVALNYASTINGFTHLNLTKLDVLSGLPELKIATKYTLGDGTGHHRLPFLHRGAREGDVRLRDRPRMGGGHLRECASGTSSRRTARRTWRRSRSSPAWSAGTSASGPGATRSWSSRNSCIACTRVYIW